MVSKENHPNEPQDMEFKRIVTNVIKEFKDFKDDTNSHLSDFKERMNLDRISM